MHCKNTHTRTSLDIWPPFPVIIYRNTRELDEEGQDSIIAALERHDRVISIDILDQECLVNSPPRWRGHSLF